MTYLSSCSPASAALRNAPTLYIAWQETVQAMGPGKPCSSMAAGARERLSGSWSCRYRRRHSVGLVLSAGAAQPGPALAPVARPLPGPADKGAGKGAAARKAEQIGDLLHRQVVATQIVEGEFLAQPI